MSMKLRMHRKFCSKSPKHFDQIMDPKKAMNISSMIMKGFEEFMAIPIQLDKHYQF